MNMERVVMEGQPVPKTLDGTEFSGFTGAPELGADTVMPAMRDRHFVAHQYDTCVPPLVAPHFWFWCRGAFWSDQTPGRRYHAVCTRSRQLFFDKKS